jgi:hypothetical protein
VEDLTRTIGVPSSSPSSSIKRGYYSEGEKPLRWQLREQ